ncbi:FAS-associated death domain protein isoform X1 [Choloepus didactylus]|uniref:FAS-associated death domain protein isoform X1 n=1 Tax=Choloepus didactylus TaxID=27675 RepID=UPI00189F1186|nr:FAS-associated death domain protein isoform X1 [Choloepus didactylus]
MDPFLVLLHSVSAGLANSELAELKFLCRGHLSKKKLERVQSGVDLFSMLLEQNELDSENTRLLRELLTSLRRQDLLRRLDDFEAGAAAQAAPQEEDLHAAFDIICDNVGKDWRRLARHLKVSDHKIEEVSEKYPRNLTEQVRASLQVWKNMHREEASVAHLVGALRACKLNLVADLVTECQEARSFQKGAGAVGSMEWNTDVFTSAAP